MRRYTFEVSITEGCDEFWESIRDKSGCEDVTDLIKDALSSRGFEHGFNCDVTLIKFENIKGK